MESKARLLSPLLVLAMLVSLVAGAVAVVVTPQTAAANGPVLESRITTPASDSEIDVSQNFLVKAVVSNTGSATATGVTANITFDPNMVGWVAGDGSTPPHSQGLGDIAAGCSKEVMWTLHCRNAGPTSIAVIAKATNTPAAPTSVIVNQMIRVEIIDPDPDCPGYEVCPSQSFTVRATVTNTGDLPITLNGTGVALLDTPDFTVTAGPTPNPGGAQFLPGESKTYMWTVHCDARSDDIIRVEVYGGSGQTSGSPYLIGYDEYAFHQRGLMVDIVMPGPGQTFCVSNDFYVNAVVTNTCGDIMYNVNATISGVNIGTGSYNATLVSGETALKQIGNIAGKVSKDVMWKVHCTAVGGVNIRVDVEGVTAFGQRVTDYDTVTVKQGTGLTVTIVEPCADPEDECCLGFFFCVCQNFVVKAHISNEGCNIIATSVTATITISPPTDASLIPEESGKASINVGDIAVGKEVIVGWTLHCDAPGMVRIIVSASSTNGLSGSDYVYVTQGDPTKPDLKVLMDSTLNSTKVSTNCNNEFTVNALVVNPSCAPLLATFAELKWLCGPGTISVDPLEKIQQVGEDGNIPGGGEVEVSWTVQCTGPGDVSLWVEAWAGNYPTHVASDRVIGKVIGTGDGIQTVFYLPNSPIVPDSETIYLGGVAKVRGTDYIIQYTTGKITFTGPPALGVIVTADYNKAVTVHQLDFITKIVGVQACYNERFDTYIVSTCQQFTVTARFENNDGELAAVDAILDYSRIGAVLVDTPVQVSYHRNVTAENPNGEPDPTKPPYSIDAIDTVPYGEGLDYGLSTVELSRLCRCCYAQITWTLECQMAVDGNLEVWAQTSGGIFLDGDSVSIDQQWKVHLVAGLEAFLGKLSDKSLVTVPDYTFSICQYFTVVATVTNIGEATATNVNVEITATGLVTPSGELTMAMAAGMAGFLSGKDCNGAAVSNCIPGGQSAKVWWELHCDGEGAVYVDVTELSGKDMNTGQAIPNGVPDPTKDNIDILCELILHQVVGEITVTICQPATCDSFNLGQIFTVKALVTNLGAAAVDVVANVTWTPTTGAALIPEENGKVMKDLGTIQPGETDEVAWVLKCMARGDLTIVVYATAAGWGKPVESNKVVVHQVGPSQITCQIISPCPETPIVTSQEFALTARIIDLAGSAAVTITSVSLNIADDPDTGMDFAEVVAGPVPAPPYHLTAGQSVIVTWTLHAISATYNPCPGHLFPICFSASGTDDEFHLPVSTSPCCVIVDVHAAAHLVVNITAPIDGTTVTVCETYTVTARVTNTGWADAWEVSASLSVFPEGSARLALSGDDARAGYTKYIGTLVGYGAAAKGLAQASATVNWVLHCKTACESTITVTAAGRDEIGSCVAQQLGGQCCPCTGVRDAVGDPGVIFAGSYPGVAIPDWLIEPDSITVKQLEAASLVVVDISYPTQVNVCQNFTVDAVVQNVGQADAEDVVATLHISENLVASLAAGTASTDPFDLAGGAFRLVSWLVHCDGASSGAIAVSADGTNTTPAIAANGSVIQIAPPVPKPCLTVEVDAPAQVTVDQSYFVTAVVSNPCDAEACDVVATIHISGEADLASGETSNTKTLGCIAAGDSKSVEWEVDCTDVGGVNITVSAAGTGTNTAIDSVAVQQVVFQDVLEALETIDAHIVDIGGEIDDGVATISTGLGTIQTSLTNIGATVTSLNGNVVTIETNLQTLKGTVTDISDGVATIVTDVGIIKADANQIAADTGTLKSRSIWTLPILILVAIGAIAIIVGVAIVASRKRPVPVVIERKGEE